MTKRAECVILGGGISGLSTAFYAKTLRIFKKVTLLESRPRLGGWIESNVTPEGATFECGPRSIRPFGIVGKNTLDLVSNLKLDRKVLPVYFSRPASQNRFIYVNKKLHRLPSSFAGLRTKQDPFSSSLLYNFLKEPFRLRVKADDESMRDFFQRRFGSEVTNYLVDPLCRGIFAGNISDLSIKSCFPMYHQAEQKYGSLVLGMLLMKQELDPAIGNTPLAQRLNVEKWASWSLENGLQTLIDHLGQFLYEHKVDIRTATSCKKIDFIDAPDTSRESKKIARIHMEGSSDVLETDVLFATIPSTKLSHLLSSDHQVLAQKLSRIEEVTVAVVNIEMEGKVLPHEGFGYLIPSCEPSPLLGVVFDSCAFPEHDRKGAPTTRITCMMGGAWFHELFGDPNSVSSEDLLKTAIETVQKQLNISIKPIYSKVSVQHHCIPQYKVGHSQLLDEMNEYIKTHRLPLQLLGASYRGVAINDCIYNARKTVLDLGR